LIAALVGTLTYNLARRMFRAENTPDGARYRRALLIVFALIVVFLLVMSPYHFTHQGVPSGSIELGLAVTLVAIGLLLP